MPSGVRFLFNSSMDRERQVSSSDCSSGRLREGVIVDRYQRYRAATKPFGYVIGPGGSSTKPSVPIRLRKSPEVLVGRGLAHGWPHSSTSTATGRKYASG